MEFGPWLSIATTLASVVYAAWYIRDRFPTRDEHKSLGEKVDHNYAELSKGLHDLHTVIINTTTSDRMASEVRTEKVRDAIVGLAAEVNQLKGITIERDRMRVNG